MSNPTDLSKHHCVPCEGGTAPLTPAEFSVYWEQVQDWSVVDDRLIKKDFAFKNFSLAMKFVDQVAALAEAEGHHPDILIHDFKFVTISLTTHAIKGLSVNDFVMAMKINELIRAAV